MWTAVYVLAIVLVNWLFDTVPPIATPLGDFRLAAVVVGVVLVLRDYAQREVGHRILVATLLAGILTWYMTNPFLALASITAFYISEMADWAIFSFTRRPLQSRILISSLVSVPLDSFAFLYLANFLSPATFSMQVLSKAAGVLIVWAMLRAREQAKLRPAA
ncbi:MAG: VUT family protein [Rhizobiales bacterium]|nr:VUT family protein [Hyphomicrobiales bacterium]MBI3674910.1 VUT family protein [Hyphomicrobiales bacterium]